jgi:hypothetical protein
MSDARSIGAAIGEKLRAMQGKPMPIRNDNEAHKSKQSQGVNISLPESMSVMMEMAGVQDAIVQLIQSNMDAIEQQRQQNEIIAASIVRSAEATNQLIAILSAPKRIVSDKDGNPIGVEVG